MAEEKEVTGSTETEKKKPVVGRRMLGSFPVNKETGQLVKPSKPPTFDPDPADERPGHAFETLKHAHQKLGKSKLHCLPPMSYKKKAEAVPVVEPVEEKKAEVALKELPKSQQTTPTVSKWQGSSKKEETK